MKCTKDIDEKSNLGFPRLIKDHQNFLKSADKHLGKLTFKIILLHRNLNFQKLINRKKMHQSIDSYFHIVLCISKLNPKKNWILLTTLGITIMFDFLIKVKIFKILLNVLTIDRIPRQIFSFQQKISPLRLYCLFATFCQKIL